MALFDFSKLNFFGKLDARSRVFVLFGAVIGMGIGIYVLSNYLSSGTVAAGPTTVAAPPPDQKSLPGGNKMTSEYYNAMKLSDKTNAAQAEKTGGAAMPTMINTGGTIRGSDPNCTILCNDDSVDVGQTINNWQMSGKIRDDVATELHKLIDANVPIAQFAETLDNLVKAGKLKPEDARELLDQYRKQHKNNAVKESAKIMDSLIQGQQLSVEAANTLLDAQKKGVSAAEYNAILQDMVRRGIIKPEVAQQLLSNYIQQQNAEAASRTKAGINDLLQNGAITPEVANEVSKLIDADVPVDTLEAKLKELVAQGKMTPEVMQKILDAYKRQKAAASDVSSIGKYIKQAEAEAYQELIDLRKENKITPETAETIRSMVASRVPFADFEKTIAALVQQNQLTPEISKLKLADYRKVVNLRALAAKLVGLQANNASAAEYSAALKEAAASGVLSPEEAAQLMSEYSAVRVKPIPSGGTEFEKLAQATNVETLADQEIVSGTAQPATGAYSEAQSQAMAQAQERERQKVENTMTGMGGQVTQLMEAWAPPNMKHVSGQPLDKDAANIGAAVAKGTGAGAAANSKDADAPGEGTPPLIKAGTILFAVLDTTVNSDYPDSPVLATIVEGKYKGAKLLGKLQISKGVSGQMDRLMLNFTLMNMDAWPKSKSATAFGIDPDTARSALASEVDYHYMQRFGALMATSFLTGYGQAAMSSGGTQVASAFGTSSTNPQLSPSSKLAVAFGQMGQALGDATKNYTNRPPTVVVDSGVGLGILFMTDVT
jgi:type IV secretory pathway VirB10-like protein